MNSTDHSLLIRILTLCLQILAEDNLNGLVRRNGSTGINDMFMLSEFNGNLGLLCNTELALCLVLFLKSLASFKLIAACRISIHSSCNMDSAYGIQNFRHFIYIYIYIYIYICVCVCVGIIIVLYYKIRVL